MRLGGPPRYKHQERGLAKMIATGGNAALLFDPGTGKTAVVLDYGSILASKVPGGEARVLVVAPLVAVDTWVLQAQQYVSPDVAYWAEALGGSITHRGEALAARAGHPFIDKSGRGRASVPIREHPRALHHRRALFWAADHRDPDRRALTASEGPEGLGTDRPRLVLEVVNLDAFSARHTPRYTRGTMADFMLEAVRRFDPHLVVVDESHKIKGYTTNASRLLDRIGQVVPRRTILTGTVMPHSPMDVFGQWRFLDPFAFGETRPDGSRRRATFTTFRERYAIMGGFMGHEYKRFVNLDEMQAIMARNAVVARKSDALDLPETTDVVIPVSLSPGEAKAYREMKAQLATMLAPGVAVTVPNRLTQMLRLRQITSGHIPDDNGVLRHIGRSKIDVIRSLVQDTLAGENRIVIFCLFSHEIAALSDVLAKEKGTTVRVVEGSTPVARRMDIRREFGDVTGHPERIVLVAQIKTMSLGVNELVTASHAIFGSLSQERDDLVQARDRLHRVGQTKPVTFWYAVAPGTVDQVILDAHDKRTDLETSLLSHIRSAS